MIRLFCARPRELRTMQAIDECSESHQDLERVRVPFGGGLETCGPAECGVGRPAPSANARSAHSVVCRRVCRAGLVALICLVAGPSFAVSPPDAAAEAAATVDATKPATKKAGAKTADVDKGIAKKADESSGFIRLRRDGKKQPVALETAITRYVVARAGKPKVTVDLIGVVHVGEKEYYAKLNKLFQQYDAVLYELVAPKKVRVPKKGQRSTHPISMLQRVLKDVLGLEFQLDHIDYGKPNMVHADMSPAEFAQSMKDRGESFMQMFFRMMGQSMMAQAKRPTSSNDIQWLMALFARDRALRLKRLMAEQFEDLESQLSFFSGPDGSTLITERNKRALHVLREQMDKGRRHLAIFYGAGHLADMEKRLRDDFHMKQINQRWLVAWNLVGSAAATKSSRPPEVRPGPSSGADDQ